MLNLKSVNIKNYKCFCNVSFSLKDINILIGENNAGKSTVIEALKLVAFGIEKSKNGHFINCPTEISENLRDKCIDLNIEDLLIDIKTASYRFNKEKSIITAYFDDEVKVQITILDNKVYVMVFKKKINLTNRKQIDSCDLPSIYVMPRFGLLKESESLIDGYRTRKDRFNYRSSLHFRNELYSYRDKIDKLNDLLYITWQNLSLKVEYRLGEDKYISCYVRDKDFETEIQSYGSGLQMWAQILWFLCKIDSPNSIVILDEPDVYIHADLQRKLYNLTTDYFNQVIIATHSIEIINEANIENILIVDKNSNKFKFCKNKSILEDALNSIGTNQNIMFTKLQKHNKCIFVEGNDISILDGLFKSCISNKSKSLKDFATCKLNGKSNYQESFGAAKLFKEDSEGTFKTYCILDKDYNEEYNKEIKEKANECGITLLILQRLEIENYLIVPRIIAKILKKEKSFIENKIIELAQSLKGLTFDRILKEKHLEYKKIAPHKDISEISKETRILIEENWNEFEKIISIVPGKELKAAIYSWAKTEFDIQITDKQILKELVADDLPTELSDFLIKMAD